MKRLMLSTTLRRAAARRCSLAQAQHDMDKMQAGGTLPGWAGARGWTTAARRPTA